MKLRRYGTKIVPRSKTQLSRTHSGIHGIEQYRYQRTYRTPAITRVMSD